MRQLVETTVKSLRNEPNRWSIDEWRAKRDDGLEVWLANGYYGMHIKPPGGPEFGGVTAISSFFGWATPWRRSVMSAVQEAAWGPYV